MLSAAVHLWGSLKADCCQKCQGEPTSWHEIVEESQVCCDDHVKERTGIGPLISIRSHETQAGVTTSWSSGVRRPDLSSGVRGPDLSSVARRAKARDPSIARHSTRNVPVIHCIALEQAINTRIWNSVRLGLSSFWKFATTGMLGSSVYASVSDSFVLLCFLYH